MREADLYPPIKAWFECQGYELRAEVKDCDVVATRGEEVIVIELKTSANLKLLIQATDRQAITPNVFVALPEPAKRNRQFRGMVRVLKRLGLGLLLVRDGPLGPTVVMEADAGSRNPAVAADKNSAPGTRARINKRRRSAVLNEAQGRSADYNVAGSHRVPLVTAYKETAIFLACCLETLGPQSPRTLKAMGGGDKTATILAKNHYGWFERVQHGVYRVTDEGTQASKQFPEIRRQSLEKIGELDPP